MVSLRVPHKASLQPVLYFCRKIRKPKKRKRVQRTPHRKTWIRKKSVQMAESTAALELADLASVTRPSRSRGGTRRTTGT